MCVSKHTILELVLHHPSVSGVRTEDILASVAGTLNLKTEISSRDVEALGTLLSKLKAKWQSAHRSKKRFIKQNQKWLDIEFCLREPVCRPASQSSRTPRRPLPFEDMSRRSKLRATKDLRQQPSEELAFAAASAMRREGRPEAGHLLEAAASPERGPHLAQNLAASERRRQPEPCTPEQALALFVNIGVNREQYGCLRRAVRSHGADVYPRYSCLREVTSSCLPAVGEILVTPASAEVRLKALLDHTTERLLEMQKEVVASLQKENGDRELTLHCFYKWGVDNSSGHSEWMQAGDVDDDQVVVTSLVPLRLTTEDGRVVWSNRAPSSPRFCRPLAVRFAKETQSLVPAEKGKVDAQVAELTPLRIQNVICSYDLQMTVVDADDDAVDTLTETQSAQTCCMCGAAPQNVNDLDAVRRLPVTNREHCLNNKHCWIRVYETLLRISYRLPVRQWQLRKEEHRKAARQVKAEVQQRMLDAMGLYVDEQRPDGTDNSNDVPAAKTAFKRSEEFAAATGIDQQLIRRLYVVLKAVSCGLPLTSEALAAYCKETAELYVHLYPWYPMPPILHCLLLHSTNVLQQCMLPVAVMSGKAEKARFMAETRLKDERLFRLRGTRGHSRQKTVADVFGRLLIASDPVISSLGLNTRHSIAAGRHSSLPREVRALLTERPPSPADAGGNGASSSDSSSGSDTGTSSDDSSD